MSLLEQIRTSKASSVGEPQPPTSESVTVSEPRPTASPPAPGAWSAEALLSAPVVTRPSTQQVEVQNGNSRQSRAHAARTESLMELKTRVHEELIRDLDPEQLTGDTSFTSPVRRAVEQAAEERLASADESLSRQERARLASDVADEVLGLGPIEPLLRDTSITEVMVNRFDRIYVERAGLISRVDMRFRDDAHVLHTIDKILRPIGRRVDDSSPMVDARLADGSRVNAIIPPLAVHGPSVTIRKFSRELFTAEDLVRLGTLNRATVDLLAAVVRSRLNILVAGGTGTGKTTMLNLLSGFVPPRERIVTIENPAELQIKQEDWVSLETRPANIEGKGQVNQRELVVNALRMRPDRIVVGECRAAEAFDMLQAMNTGHDGSMTTVHANSPRDALARIENMVLMAVDLPVQAIREQIASGLNLVVQIARMQDGSRRVTHVAEIVGMQGAVVSMHNLFEFQGRGVDAQGRVVGQLQATGLRPHFMDRLTQFGEHLPVETFLPSHGGAGDAALASSFGD
jgi:pilus assembly protein CpaF